MKKSVLLNLLAVLTLGHTTLSAFEQPAVQQLTAKDHIVIFGDSTTAGGLKSTGYIKGQRPCIQ